LEFLCFDHITENMWKKIGVFDSGVGGFTVVHELRQLLPWQPLVYFGDTARTPYGTKSPETIIQYAREDTRFLLEHGAGIIVIACHSAASTATQTLRREFDIPIFEVVTSSIDQAVGMTLRKTVGVMGTRATITTGVYEREIRNRCPEITVYSQACPLLVPLVEEGWLKARETRMIVRKYLRTFKDKGVDTLVLGCTHYPLLKNIIKEKMGQRVKIIDPSAEVARAVYEHLRAEKGLCEGELGEPNRFFLSDLTPTTQDVVERFLGERVVLEKAQLPCAT
jgi:glutamate racemase